MKITLHIKNGTVFSVYLKKFIKADVFVIEDRIFYVGKDESLEQSAEKTIDATGKWILPGLIDIHMHIESSMATPISFTRQIMKNGVTTIVAEPHEIANVCGTSGVKAMIENGKRCDIDVFIGVPSCVPSTSPELETTGGILGEKEIHGLLSEDGVKCLGEFMNYKDLVTGESSKSHGILKMTRDNFPQYPIEGHCPNLTGVDLAKFIYYGVNSDHTKQSPKSLVEKVNSGMFIEIQEKTINPEIIKTLNEYDIYRHVSLVTDDVMASHLMDTGHLDNVIKKAVAAGMTIENAITLATLNPAIHMGLRDRGAVAPSKLADLIILDDLESFSVEYTLKNGKIIYKRGEAQDTSATDCFPDEFYSTVKLGSISKDQLRLVAPAGSTSVQCRVMQVKDGTTYTAPIIKTFKVQDGEIITKGTGCCVIAVFERHGKNGNIGLGLITGDTIDCGAVATTYAHDHHNLLIIGENISDMVLAANTVIKNQGGMCTVEEGEILATLKLPIGGIISSAPMSEISKHASDIEESLRTLGYKHYSPIMSLATNSLIVSPTLKISDMGLIMVDSGEIVPLIV